MEATKERRDQTQKKHEEHNTKFDSMGELAREIIRESIISKDADGKIGSHRGGGNVVKEPDDVLAYSRTVHQTDSSLE
ncbi:hypothetical protein F511_06639 [Dorcoceras hygrometricum]|uniref:Uncharacterized protein n=1 Tax=Dorcoceras hygrometricum TaxID=472368 RepID=A0A2Z7B5J1_9LAMI|nr:hypothetical protein F511_06639 [Dorcoceras hygrometricum]